MEFLIEATMQLIAWRLKLWIHVRLADLFRYGIGQARPATLNDIGIIHSSQNFLVINKRYDVLINSDDRSVEVTVEHQLRNLFPSLASPNLVHGFYFIHRLDYPTSGILCIACNKQAAACASDAFEKRKTKKYYIALLRGHVSQELIDITHPIGTDSRLEEKAHRMCIKDDKFCQKPRWAHTRLLVLEIGFYDHQPVTKVMLKPITGRRHQLRVHCSSLGHTIVGDFTYSNQKDFLPYRMFLHAHRLILPNHVEPIDVTSGDIFGKKDHSKWISLLQLNAIDQNSYDKLDQNDRM